MEEQKSSLVSTPSDARQSRQSSGQSNASNTSAQSRRSFNPNELSRRLYNNSAFGANTDSSSSNNRSRNTSPEMLFWPSAPKSTWWCQICEARHPAGCGCPVQRISSPHMAAVPPVLRPVAQRTSTSASEEFPVPLPNINESRPLSQFAQSAMSAFQSVPSASASIPTQTMRQPDEPPPPYTRRTRRATISEMQSQPPPSPRYASELNPRPILPAIPRVPGETRSDPARRNSHAMKFVPCRKCTLEC